MQFDLMYLNLRFYGLNVILKHDFFLLSLLRAARLRKSNSFDTCLRLVSDKSSTIELKLNPLIKNNYINKTQL